MNELQELESRLRALPDIYPDFVEGTMRSLQKYGLVSDVLKLLRNDDSATTDTVLIYEMSKRGVIDVTVEETFRETHRRNLTDS